ncbi:hypothetical protein CUZ96_2530 [Enterococcus lactis]|nr:hypothetical protein CUO_1508 [Enterococcus faecium PC4.1]MBL5000485.1 hypothetical protein [Enterococcus lactis]MBL5012862.1 hypothetical protein [Enterococcus lactis]MBL5013986.1 hypothetical protein [Enterococcus lactis]SJX70973.1 hypothetical protein FM130_09665 [Enterococcus faecium]
MEPRTFRPSISFQEMLGFFVFQLDDLINQNISRRKLL